jgi:hypothetical protein
MRNRSLPHAGMSGSSGADVSIRVGGSVVTVAEGRIWLDG